MSHLDDEFEFNFVLSTFISNKNSENNIIISVVDSYGLFVLHLETLLIGVSQENLFTVFYPEQRNSIPENSFDCGSLAANKLFCLFTVLPVT